MVVFILWFNFYFFEERRVFLMELVKIGCLVVKSRLVINNCIFDCKVLLRNYVILWYEDGKVSEINGLL